MKKCTSKYLKTNSKIEEDFSKGKGDSVKERKVERRTARNVVGNVRNRAKMGMLLALERPKVDVGKCNQLVRPGGATQAYRRHKIS